jgi:uncharacterized protein (UPF0212 family)
MTIISSAEIYNTDIYCEKYKGSQNIISCGLLSGNNEIVTDATRLLIERISGIVNIYKVNTPNLDYVKVTVGNECPKIYSDHHALIVKIQNIKCPVSM